jgi:hypothetical protein
MTATLNLTCWSVLPVATAISAVVRPSMSNTATALRLARNLSSGNRCLRSVQSRMLVLYYSGTRPTMPRRSRLWRATANGLASDTATLRLRIPAA